MASTALVGTSVAVFVAPPPLKPFVVPAWTAAAAYWGMTIKGMWRCWKKRGDK